MMKKNEDEKVMPMYGIYESRSKKHKMYFHSYLIQQTLRSTPSGPPTPSLTVLPLHITACPGLV
jgi:hypothetical protein